jgi:outer membrane lipoprotein-sorting protein
MPILLASCVFACLFTGLGVLHAAMDVVASVPATTRQSQASVPQGGEALRAQQPTEDQKTLTACEDYLNQFRSLQARFVQLAPDGHTVYGRFYLQRPDHLRLEYEDTIPLRIVADDRQLAYYDKDLKDVTYFSPEGHPAAFFLQPKIAFSGIVKVQSVTRGLGHVRIELVRTSDDSEGSLTLVFQDKPLALQQWCIKDASGQITTITLLDLQTDVALPSELFQIKYDDPNLHVPDLQSSGQRADRPAP